MIRSVTVATLGATMAVSVALAQSAPPKVILLVGPPGSGKTTQAKFLAKKYGIPAISMSDLLKREMSSGKKDALTKPSPPLSPAGTCCRTTRLRIWSGRLSSGLTFGKASSWTAFPPPPGRRRRWIGFYKTSNCRKPSWWCLTFQTMSSESE